LNLDFNNPTVQVAFIAAVAAIVTALFSLLTALVTALVTLFNHLFEARAKRLEKIKDIRSEKAQQLLESITEMHADLNYHLQSTVSLKYSFLELISESDESTQAERLIRFKYRLVRFKYSMKSSHPEISDIQRVDMDMQKDWHSWNHWLDSKIISSLFWFPKPLRLKGKLETLLREFGSVYIFMSIELNTLSNLEKQVYENPDITPRLRQEILDTAKNKFLKESQDKAFKTVVQVQRLLALHMQ
jgi:hypothetical protein